MVVELVLAASVLLQLAAAILALRLTRLTGENRAWVLLATAVSMQTIRRAIPLWRLVSGDVFPPPDLVNELVGLAISALMLAGMAYIAPLFFSIKLAEENMKEYSERLEEVVEERTIELR